MVPGPEVEPLLESILACNRVYSSQVGISAYSMACSIREDTSVFVLVEVVADSTDADIRERTWF